MKLIRFDTIAYKPPPRAETRFPVLAGQLRCSTGATLRGGDTGDAARADANAGDAPCS